MNRRHLIVAAVLVAGVSACSEPAPPAPPPAASPAPATAEARVKLYTTCWDQFNSKAFDQFQNCFSENATSEFVDSASQPTMTGRAAIMDVIKKEVESFPDRHGELKLVLGNGARIAGVALYTATNTGPMPGPDGKPMPATNKKVGLLMGHTIELDAMGTHAIRESAYLDEETLAGQLGLSPHPVRPVMAATGAAPEVVVAKNDATETANLAAVRAMMDAGNKHDLKAVEAMLTDDYKLIEIGQQKDLDKKAALASNRDFLKAFPDLTTTASDVWAAGDYVVIVGKVDATNKGPMPAMGIKKATGKKFTGRFLEICKMENGKVKQDWLFYNAATLAGQLGLK